MGISSSLNAGVMGLGVNATKLATISENIANSATYGYKRVDTDFSSMVLDFAPGGYTAGGVRANTVRFVADQGALTSTNNSTDISVSGSGFLPVTDLNGLNSSTGQRELFLTTTGAFRPDEDGFLRTNTGYYLMGWPADSNGEVQLAARDSSVGLEPINVLDNQLSSSPTTEIQLGVNLPASATSAGAPGDAFEAPIEYFDNLGRSQTLTFEFIPNPAASTGASNEWSVNVYDAAGATPATPIASFDLEFEDGAVNPGSISAVDDGGLGIYDPATGNVTLDVASGQIQLNIGTTDGSSRLTQFSADFSPVGINKDGVAVGNLSTVEIGEDGMLEAVYDTGFRRTIYQVPVADVPNPNGLRAADGQAFTISQGSGDVYFWDAGSGPVGTTVGFALTESTTDVASELTDLIETQRAYSSNARIIQTVDEMLEETTNLKR